MSLQTSRGTGTAGLTALIAISAACSRGSGPPETASPNADRAWVESVCNQPMPDTTGWRRYQLGYFSIAVPPQYQRTRFMGQSLRFIRGDKTTMTIALGTERAFSMLDYRGDLNGRVVCEASYGGYPSAALSWSGRGEYLAVTQWPELNVPDERPSVLATIRTNRLRDAVALRAALQTIRKASDDAPAPTGNPDAWFYAPCASDSVDSFDWTRYDLREIRIRVPRDIRRVPMPEVNELHFQKGRARMRLRLHNDASQLFAVYRQPTKAYKYCQGEMAGLAIEAVSFRDNGNYGFAARWADADRGEWLAAVVTAPTIHEATALRRSLFTLTFPGMKR